MIIDRTDWIWRFAMNRLAAERPQQIVEAWREWLKTTDTSGLVLGDDNQLHWQQNWPAMSALWEQFRATQPGTPALDMMDEQVRFATQELLKEQRLVTASLWSTAGRFKEGDIVKVIEAPAEMPSLLGMRGKIHEPSGAGYFVQLFRENGKDWGLYDFSDEQIEPNLDPLPKEEFPPPFPGGWPAGMSPNPS